MNTSAAIRRQRWRLLQNLIHLVDPAMAVLEIAWLFLLVVEFTDGLSPVLTAANRVIWIVFVVDFFAELAVAPDKRLYLRRHWLAAVSLAVPAVRIVRLARIARIARIARAGRIARGTQLVRTLGSMNRAMS